VKNAKDGKTANITIRVSENLKERAEKIWQRKYEHLPFNTFLGHMVSLGLAEEEILIAMDASNKARIREAPQSQMPSVSIELAKLKGQVSLLAQAIEKGTTLENISSPVHGIKKGNMDEGDSPQSGGAKIAG
jgi:hypothetical protein